jgi:hypothetical protein
MPLKPWGEEEIKKLRELHAQGKKDAQIAQELFLLFRYPFNARSVESKRRALRIMMVKESWTKELDDILLKAHEAGASGGSIQVAMAEIGHVFTLGAIRHRRHKLGLIHSEEVWRKIKSENPPPKHRKYLPAVVRVPTLPEVKAVAPAAYPVGPKGFSMLGGRVV